MPSPGNGWLHLFKAHHGIVFKEIVGEAASANEDVDTIFTQTKPPAIWSEMSTMHVKLCRLTRCSQTKYMPKGDSRASGKHSKVHVTVILCTNVDGNKWRKPFITDESKKPHCYHCYVPVRYGHNAKEWMTHNLFPEWLGKSDLDLHNQGMLLVLGTCLETVRRTMCKLF